MVPLGPGQLAVVVELGVGIEVGAGAQHGPDTLALKIQRNDGRDGFTLAAVVLADRQHQIALRMQAEVGVAVQ